MSKSEFLKIWSREAVNQPGLMVETVALQSTPVRMKPVMRKTATAA